MSAENAGYSLAHPVYLDVPMMLSFLAHLEGGVSMSEEETRTASGARERMISGRLGARLRLWGVGNADGAAEANTQRREEASSESKTERHHTAASLFNLLYDYLREDEQLITLSSASQLAEIRSGQLVELDGEYLGNPLEDILAFFQSLFGYLQVGGAESTEASSSPAAGSRSSNPAKRQAAKQAAASQAPIVKPPSVEQTAVDMLLRMGSDITSAPVHDLLFQTGDGLKAVVTVASEYYSATTNEYLRASEFRVVGKVTKVVQGEKSINLTRRTVLGAAGPDMAESMMSSVNTGDMSLDIAEPIVRAPAVQILPMAIFI